MALDLSPEEKETGRANFHRVVGKLAEADQQAPQAGGQQGGVTRRRFMQGLIAAGATVPVSAAAYYGYSNRRFPHDFRPVKAALIGAGDEGGVLVGAHNPNYVNFIACSDIRPSNKKRIFNGQAGTPRLGFNAFKEQYGASDMTSQVRWYDNYHELLENPDIEMVVIALPLHLHAEVAIEAMQKGKHVLCEKLMAWNITQCKRMIRTSDETHKLLAIGHQRHYSMLYAHANEVVRSGVLGEVRHIRAQWHRNNARPNPDAATRNERPYLDSWWPIIPGEDRQALEGRIRQVGYKDMNELVRWRIYTRTGGGLMAELGSHQLDACSIFLGKKHPLAITAVGGKNFYRDNREAEDHVYCIYEFPGAGYDPNVPARNAAGANLYNDKVTVTYSSISTNGLEHYGECVMGTKGTLIVQGETDAYLYGINGRRVDVTAGVADGRATLVDSSSSAPPSAPAETRAAQAGQTAVATPISRGYREEMEHLAYCIRMREQNPSPEELERLKPRCDGRAAMADAIIALTANQAMKRQTRIVFDSKWFDPALNDVPDADMVEERIS
jgi:predicted dehydrogenase